MNFSFKRCRLDNDKVDRISNLPDCLLSQILPPFLLFLYVSFEYVRGIQTKRKETKETEGVLSLLPTKDAASIGVLSRKMRHAFTQVTTLDLDGSHISYCSQLSQPRLVERTSTFTRFVDSVLGALHSPPYFSKFKLRFGGIHRFEFGVHRCQEDCIPYFEPAHINSWICYPLNLDGGSCRLTELELNIHLRNPGTLPSAIFACKSLEVLKLDVCLSLDQVCAMPSFCLPNLKVFHLGCTTIPDDDFLPRLISSCPVLEDLALDNCTLKLGDYVTIFSPSLRRLHLLTKTSDDLNCANTVHINTPNLHYLHYYGHHALQYNVTYMGALVEAHICILETLPEISVQDILFLLGKVSNVQHLILGPLCTQILDIGHREEEEEEDELPVLRNLTLLRLIIDDSIKWDKFLLEFLQSSPRLETPDLPEGISCDGDAYEEEFYIETGELERQCWRTSHAIPECCRSHLKRIVIHKYWGLERELDIVKFLLKITWRNWF